MIAFGRLQYHIGFAANPGYRGGNAGLFSDELRAEIRRRNVPESRTVSFDASHSRTEEINPDYGVRSRCFKLRVAGSEAITYCKEFRYFNFCVEHPVLLPLGGPPPHLSHTGESATIAGMACSKAEYQGSRHLFVWYTDEVAVNDPTGAVLHLEGVPGLVMQTEEIPVSDTTDAVKRMTVVELTFDAPSREMFSVPPDYRRFVDIDAVRAEDRRILDARSTEELQRQPLSVRERDMFVGTWLFDRAKDKILVEIARVGANEFRFQTTVSTAPADVVGRRSDEKASMKGRLLMVEDPPNYRLYQLREGGRSLTLVDNELFIFNRL